MVKEWLLQSWGSCFSRVRTLITFKHCWAASRSSFLAWCKFSLKKHPFISVFLFRYQRCSISKLETHNIWDHITNSRPTCDSLLQLNTESSNEPSKHRKQNKLEQDTACLTVNGMAIGQWQCKNEHVLSGTLGCIDIDGQSTGSTCSSTIRGLMRHRNKHAAFTSIQRTYTYTH